MTAVVTEEQLGTVLSADELQILRQSHAHLGSSSSRAASRASSHGVLMLDSSSLAALARYFDRIMGSIEQSLMSLSSQAQVFTQVQYDRAGNVMAGADAEIQRFHQLMAQIDNLETEMDRIANIKAIVKDYRARVEEVDRKLEESAAASSSRHHSSKHSSSKHSSSKHSSSSHKHSSSKHHSSSSSHRHKKH